jgi:hypothetical protein
MEYTDDTEIQSAGRGNEYRLEYFDDDGKNRCYYLDGYCEKLNTAYEYNGCYTHGCPKCFPNLIEKLEKTKKKESIIQNQGFILKSIWACDWMNLKKLENVASSIKSFHHLLALNPKEAFFGGRTEVFKHYVNTEVNSMLRIYYRDITSSYPYQMFYKDYPVGHPTIIKKNFDYSLNSYFGVIKCKVKFPKLYIGVLPVHKNDGGLAFPIDGVLVGTWCSEELKVAIQEGYEILEIYEVHHFKMTSNTLFKSYISRHLKSKQEASGYPSWVQSEEDKDTYIYNYNINQGIQLEKDKIKKDGGRKQVAKLCLNNLWGRFVMRIFSDGTVHITCLEDYHKLISNKHINLNTLDALVLNNDTALFSYETTENVSDSWMTTNIYIGVFTTCYGRLHLYRGMKDLGHRVIYCDTDSVLYYHEDHDIPPIGKDGQIIHGFKCGDYLGEWTDELDNHWIKVFASSGEKSYGYMIDKNPNCKDDCKICNSQVIKTKGITLTHENSQIFTLDKMIDLVFGNEEHINTQTFRIQFDKKAQKLQSVYSEKTVSLTGSKRIISSTNDWLIDTTPISIKDL